MFAAPREPNSWQSRNRCCRRADIHKRQQRVKPGHWVLLPKLAGNGFRKNLTALPQRAGRGSVRGWRDKNAFLGYRRLLGIQCRLRRYVTWLLLGVLFMLHSI